MQIFFIILFISVNELLYQVASQQRMGLNPYPFGSTILCYITHLILLITCIWYFGWLWGIFIFICSFFSLLHSIVGWILVIPTLFNKEYSQLINTVKFEIALLTPSLIISLIFCIVSFFTTEFMSLTYFFEDNLEILPALVVIALILLIIRIAAVKKLSQDLE